MPLAASKFPESLAILPLLASLAVLWWEIALKGRFEILAPVTPEVSFFSRFLGRLANGYLICLTEDKDVRFWERFSWPDVSRPG